jgi:WD40 repeat protein
VLFTFKQGDDSEGITSGHQEVTSISFRTDAAAERFPYMVSGGADGRVYIWNLGTPHRDDEPRRLMYTLEEAHGNHIMQMI